MKQYHDLVKHVLETGTQKGDRTGTGTKTVFGYQMRFDLAEGFPMVTTKKLHLKSIIYELLWFLKGDTNIAYLKENGVKIWDEWADENGNLGPVYGHQWCNWNSEEIHQITELIETLKNNPDSRRMSVSAWNPSVLPDTSTSTSGASAGSGPRTASSRPPPARAAVPVRIWRRVTRAWNYQGSGLLSTLIVRKNQLLDVLFNISLGVIGAFVAGWLFTPLFGIRSVEPSYFSASSLLISLAGAMLLLAIVHFFRWRAGQSTP